MKVGTVTGLVSAGSKAGPSFSVTLTLPFQGTTPTCSRSLLSEEPNRMSTISLAAARADAIRVLPLPSLLPIEPDMSMDSTTSRLEVRRVTSVELTMFNVSKPKRRMKVVFISAEAVRVRTLLLLLSWGAPSVTSAPR